MDRLLDVRERKEWRYFWPNTIELPLTEKKPVGRADLGEDLEFSYGHRKFETPIGYPSGGVIWEAE